jgi:hypothetical protein
MWWNWWIWHINVISKLTKLTSQQSILYTMDIFGYLYASAMKEFLVKTYLWGRWCFEFNHSAIIGHVGFGKFNMAATSN